MAKPSVSRVVAMFKAAADPLAKSPEPPGFRGFLMALEDGVVVKWVPRDGFSMPHFRVVFPTIPVAVGIYFPSMSADIADPQDALKGAFVSPTREKVPGYKMPPLHPSIKKPKLYNSVLKIVGAVQEWVASWRGINGTEPIAKRPMTDKELAKRVLDYVYNARPLPKDF